MKGVSMKSITVATAALCLCALAADAAPRKKVIGCGWGFNTATVDDFLSHAELFDETGLDGVLVWLRGRNPDGKSVGMRNIYEEDWTHEAFAPMVPKLKLMTEHEAFRENFLITMRSPRDRKEWTDDAVWARLAENMRVAARIAKEGGCRGLHMDLEDYCKVRQFFRQPGELPYAELCRLARRRGAQVFGGVFREFPEARVLSFWFLSWLPTWYHGQDIQCLTHDRQDLWPSFVNGILDVMPPTARLIDGNEHAYRFSSDRNDFASSAHRTRTTLLPLVEPENRTKYKEQMLVGFGHYLDMYTNPTNSSWYFPPKNGSRLLTFQLNLEQSMDVADEYVWVYGERHQFVKWKGAFNLNKGCKTERWEDRLPGFNDSIAAAKDRDGFGRKRTAELASRGLLRNLAVNGECAGKDGALPEPFGCWQPGKKENHKGVFGSDQTHGDGDSTSLCAEGVPSGCFTTTVKNIAPGGLYLVKCSAYGEGTSAVVAWKDAKRKWTGQSEYMPFRETYGEWRRGSVVVRAPVDAKDLHLHLGVSLAPDEKCRFDSIEIYLLDSVEDRPRQ